jgi:hypothetical protein
MIEAFIRVPPVAVQETATPVFNLPTRVLQYEPAAAMQRRLLRHSVNVVPIVATTAAPTMDMTNPFPKFNSSTARANIPQETSSKFRVPTDGTPRLTAG